MRRKLFALLIVLGFSGLCLGLAWARPNQAYLRQQAFKPMAKALLEQLQQQGGNRPLKLLEPPLPPELRPLMQTQLEALNADAKGQPVGLQARWSETEQGYRLGLRLAAGAEQSQERPRWSWYHALPPIVTITVALLSQNLLLALFVGILFGSILAAGGHPLVGFAEVFSRHGWAALSDVFHLQILAFSALLLGMVGIMNVGGGTRGIVSALQRFIAGRRSTQLLTGVMGLLIFFDDYANCFVIGTTLRPVTDAHRISREKLAYLVDSTAAPDASLAIVSTWIGYQLGLINDALGQLGGEKLSAFQLFLAAAPLRFYSLLSLALVLLVVLLRRDFGPMYRAERRALEQGLVLRDGAVPLTTRTFNGLDAPAGIPLRWLNAALPVAVVVLATLGGLFISGGGLRLAPQKIFRLQALGDVFAAADSGQVLLWSSGLGCLSAALLAWPLLGWRRLIQAWFKGVSAIALAGLILVMTWMISHITAEIGTATYLIALFRDAVQPLWLAAGLYLLAAAIAFSIGSSWSTMALMIPVALPLAHEVGGLPLTVLTLAAVLDGCIFGDNCSPLADTTVLSAIACSSDLLDHVRTQLPYGLLALFTAAVCGFLPAGLGWPFWLLLPLGLLALVGFLRLFGRNPEADADLPAPILNHLPRVDPRAYSD